ncbi:MAG: O-antigen ligase family protein [Thermoleophilia bacterium]|nr:O-antigen ligase family protein [Thermoleophilia bacterium]
MNVLDQSLLGRGGRLAGGWIERAARASLTGRGLATAARGLGGAFGGSRVFGLREAPRPLVSSGHPLSVLAVARPYLWLREVVGGSAARALPLGRAVAGSAFAGGGWLRVAGAGVVGLGTGYLVAHLRSGAGAPAGAAGLGAALIAAGALLCALPYGSIVRWFRGCGVRRVASAVTALVEGPRVLSGSRSGSSDRTAPAIRAEDRVEDGVRVCLVSGMVLALAAGLVGGLSGGSGALTVVAVVLALGALALVLWRPEVVLFAAAAFPWLDWTARQTLGGLGGAWDDALLLLSLALLLWCVIVQRRWALWTVPVTLPTILALAAAVGSIVVRHVPSDVAIYALRMLFQPVLFYFVGFLLPKTRRSVQWVVAVFVLACVGLALHGIYQYVTDAPMPAQWVDRLEVGIGTRAYSIVENPNGLGAVLLIGVSISLSLALAPGLSGLQRGAMAVACAILLTGEAVTFSRGGWIGLIVGVVALLVLAYRRYLAPLVAVGVVGWFVMPRVVINRLTFAFSSSYIAQSLAFGRLWIWTYALRQIAAHPLFGVGLGTFGGTAAVRFSYGSLWVDNFYLQLAAEGGLLLLFLFLWVLLSAAKGLVKAHRTTGDPYLRALAAGGFGAFVAVAGANFTASVWETLVVGVGFWFMTGLATSACFQDPASTSTREGA